MTKKELEEELEVIKVDYQYLQNIIDESSKRIQENIDLIEEHLKKEKNKEKKKLLGGLLNEFQYIKNILTMNDLSF